LDRNKEELLGIFEEMQHYSTRTGLAKLNKKLGLVPARIRWIQRYRKIAAVIMLPLLIASSLSIVILIGKLPAQSEAWHRVETLPGQKSILDLPDGTRVWMNSGTSISYPINFLEENREIKLQGEAFFDVAHDKKRPFIVSLNDLNVHVLGTAFNVSNYPDENENSIYLESGSIELHSTTNNTERLLYRMKPGERAIYSKNRDKLMVGTGHDDESLAWLEGKLIFRDESMASVVRSLNRWFNVEISVIDEEILDYTYTATFQNESLEQILELLEKSARINYKIIDREKVDNDIFTKTRVELSAPR
jgi:ferric-dicitrate binding protein FerR (iron transport regulator)